MKLQIISVLFIVGFFYLGISLIPKYPAIDENKPFDSVMQTVNKVSLHNIKKYNFRYMGDKRKLLNFHKEVKNYTVKLDRCGKNSKCIVDQYNDFMDDNILPSIRQANGYMYIKARFGRMGVMINKLFYIIFIMNIL